MQTCPLEIRIIHQDDPMQSELYTAAADFVADTYRNAFGACMRVQPPRFVMALDQTGAIVCAAGVRTAGDGFAAQVYADLPINDLISDSIAAPVSEADILEVGGLAFASPFYVFPTLRTIFDWGRARDITWGLFTATAPVRRLILRAGIAPLLLVRAEAARAPAAQSWGSYYNHDPWVCAFADPAQGAGQNDAGRRIA